MKDVRPDDGAMDAVATALKADWKYLADSSTLPLVLLAAEHGDRSRIAYANLAAAALLNDLSVGSPSVGSLADVIDWASRAVLQAALERLATADEPDVSEVVVTAKDHQGTEVRPAPVALRLRQLPWGGVSCELTALNSPGTAEIVLVQQQLFRSALLELSDLAHSTEDDDVFYQRLLERAVDVVPGAQAGSVQINIAGTTRYRFVAAVGFDLEALQKHELDQTGFFRDTVEQKARIVRAFHVDARSDEITDWLVQAGRLDEMKVNVSVPVWIEERPVAFISLDNFDDPDAFSDVSVEMTTVLGRQLAQLLRRRELEAALRDEREAYRQLAMRDPLTGLANRRHLERELERVVAENSDLAQPTAVLFIDIDDFKGVNDRLGHANGDRLLGAVAAVLQDELADLALIGRWGGDEFVGIVPTPESSAAVEAAAEKIIERFATPLDLDDGHAYRGRVSIGIGWTACTDSGAENLVRTADRALYEAKAAGKGLVRVAQV